MKKRTLFLLLILLFIGGVSIGVIRWHLPKLEQFATFYVNQLNKNEQVPVTIAFEAIAVNLFPLGISLTNSTFSPKKQLANKFKPVTIKTIHVQPSLIDLLIGKFWIDRLSIEEATVTANLSAGQTNDSGKLPIPDLDVNRLLPAIPISEIQLKKVKLHLNYNNEYQITTDGIYLRAINQKSSLLTKIKESNLKITNLSNHKSLETLVDVQFMLTATSLSISKLKIVKDKSYLIGSGSLRHKGNFANIVEARFSTRVKSDFNELGRGIETFVNSNNLESINGEFKFDFEFEKGVDQEMQYRLRGGLGKFQVADVLLGDFELNAEARGEQQIRIPRLVARLAGRENIALINQLNIKRVDKRAFEFDFDMMIKRFQLQTFLKDSGITDIPVWLVAEGGLKCLGSFNEKLKINCPGKLTITDLKVQTKSSRQTIVELAKANLEVEASITEAGIGYKGKLTTANSQGTSDGYIDFEKGFNINYESPEFHFKDVGKIANLDFAGVAKLKGSTKGNARSAVFNIDAQASNFEFAQYFLGDSKISLNYRQGTLYFKSIEGSLESTRYLGQLDVILDQERLVGNFGIPFFRMRDLQQAVLKKLDLKEQLQGSGSGQLKLDTSFDIDKLSFSLQAQLFKGESFGEQFDEAQLQAVATDGVIAVKRATLIKKSTKFDMSGTLNMNLDTDLKFVVNNADLNDSSIFRKLGVPISGDFSATGRIANSLKEPQFYVSADVKNFAFNKSLFGNAKFTFRNNDEHNEINFSIEKKLYSNIKIPKGTSSDYDFTLEAEALDLAPIIGFAIADGTTPSYVISIAGEASGKVNPKNLWGSEFSANLKMLNISYKGNELTSKFPVNAELKNTQLFINELQLEGENQYLKVTQSETGPYQSQFLINSRINISFFKIFAPFIERIDGFSTVRLELNLARNGVKLTGSSLTNDAYVQLPKFPHPFEAISADILFNQNKVFINSITGRMAGGKILGNGEFLVLGPKEYNLIINLEMEKVNLTFPEDVSTVGDAQVTLSGSGLPFNMTGSYDIVGGLIEMEFADSGDKAVGSSLLPMLLQKEQQSPINLDLKINAANGIDVKNSMVEGKVFGNIRVFDKAESPRISGDVNFGKASRLNIRDTEFQITESKFQFRGRQPMDPTLFMTAKTRVQSYDISMLLQGTASAPKISLTSQPPLTEQKIISLLAFGYISNDLEDQTVVNSNNPNNTIDSTNSAAQSSSLQIGTTLLNRNPLGREIKQRFGLDVDFATSIDEVTGLAVPKITLKKDLDKNVEVSISRQEGQTSQTELRLRYELNEDLSTVMRARRRENQENSQTTSLVPQNDSVLGLDLEYRLEFK